VDPHCGIKAVYANWLPSQTLIAQTTPLRFPQSAFHDDLP